MQLTNLTQTLACHLCTFNVAAIFFRGHPLRHHMPCTCLRLMFESIRQNTSPISALAGIEHFHHVITIRILEINSPS